MNQSYRQNSQRLQQLMEQVGINSIGQLGNVAEVSERQIIRLQYGLLLKMPVETLLKLSQALQVTPRQLLTQFAPESVPDEQETDADSLKQEYQRLQQQLEPAARGATARVSAVESPGARVLACAVANGGGGSRKKSAATRC